ncbi:MAG: CoA transferase [Alphaproteobacteria bacterium]|nr:CoA transferase [Alphaproteobacteria bacterium]
MALLAGLTVVQLGDGLAAAVCGRLFADVGAAVHCLDPDTASPLTQYLNHGKAVATPELLGTADLLVVEGAPRLLRGLGRDPESLRRLNPSAAIVAVSPYGQTGPQADDPATDLTLLYASGIARMLTGQVDDLSEPPIRPVGEQSAFMGGLAAACAGMHAVMAGAPAMMDVSIQEALATIAITELARAGTIGKSWGRKRLSDGNGATVCILPARDGFAAISPRDDHQWAAWLTVMGSPDWGTEPRFAKKSDRVANWDALHALMSEWSRQYDKQQIADMAQAAHVPSFPLREPAEQLASPQLGHRNFFRPFGVAGRVVQVPSPPFGIACHSAAAQVGASPRPSSSLPYRTGSSPAAQSPGGGHAAPPLPLNGVRVLDFSWVIAGPTTTRYLAAMGAEVIKVEAPGRGDPGRSSELHTVLGQAKRGIVLDLKNPAGVAMARALAAQCDMLVENFATGVMDRLGLGADALREINPDLIYVSASGLGRTGPEARGVAYGTLLQCYAGFAGLNRHPRIAPRVGLAWLDPMCGLMLAFVSAAALWHRRRNGQVARIDFSMLEAMLWTMAEPLLAAQLEAPPRPVGNYSPYHAPHNAFRCAGDDAWLSLAISGTAEWHRLCEIVPALAPLAALEAGQREEQANAIDAALSAWAEPQAARTAAARLAEAGLAAAPLASSGDLVDSEHLRARGFWAAQTAGVLPGLPWRASFAHASGPAPALGGDTEMVLHQLLQLSQSEISALREAGALGSYP